MKLYINMKWQTSKLSICYTKTFCSSDYRTFVLVNDHGELWWWSIFPRVEYPDCLYIDEVAELCGDLGEGFAFNKLKFKEEHLKNGHSKWTSLSILDGQT